jgi:hypothetical protein
VSKHSNKIWRSVVFSGAMLGTQVVAADTAKPPAPPQQAKQKPPPPTPRELAQRDYDDASKRVDEAMDAIGAAATQADRDAAKKKLDAARTDRSAAEKKLAGYPPPAPPVYQDPTAVKKLEKQISDLDVKIGLTADTVAGAPSDADRKMATTKLASLRKERQDASTKLVAEKAKPPKRPRQPDEPRPTGRGFILS